MKSFREIRQAFPYFTLVDDNRLKLIYDKVIETKDVQGEMAEIGVYRGGSSFIISQTNPYKTLYACDSFEGLPEADSTVDLHTKGDFHDVSLDDVKKILDFPNVRIIKGFFPNSELHQEMYTNHYSFVHIDVDLYKPTLECLEWFYPRMSKGAVLISDDYTLPSCPGVKKAFDEFMKHKPEKLIDSGHKSCYFVKE